MRAVLMILLAVITIIYTGCASARRAQNARAVAAGTMTQEQYDDIEASQARKAAFVGAMFSGMANVARSGSSVPAAAVQPVNTGYGSQYNAVKGKSDDNDYYTQKRTHECLQTCQASGSSFALCQPQCN